MKNITKITFGILSVLTLAGCTTAKETLTSIIENTTTPIELAVHKVENGQILVNVFENFQYTLFTENGTSELKLFEDEVLFFSHTYSGIINQEDITPSVFYLDGSFYFLQNHLFQGVYLGSLHRISDAGEDETLLSRHFDNGMSTYFYLDDFNSSFIFTFQENNESQYSFVTYRYQDGLFVNDQESTRLFPTLYLGIREIIHKNNGDTYLCTNNGVLYKNGELQDSFSASSPFIDINEEICFYGISKSAYDENYSFERQNVDTHVVTPLKTLNLSGASLLYESYVIGKNGIFVLRTPEARTSVKNSIFSVFVYDYAANSFSAFYIIEKRVSNVCFHGSRLFFETETRSDDPTLSYIDFLN